MAAIAALEALKKPCTVELHTDSKYVHDGISKWIHGWKRNGWKTADKKPVKNVDLWQRLDAALARHDVHWRWVKGHAGHEMNERADELARRGDRRSARGAEMNNPSPRRCAEKRGQDFGRCYAKPIQSTLFSRLSAPETSALPGASSTLSVFTTPSSTTMA